MKPSKQEIILALIAIVVIFLVFKGIKDAFKNLLGTIGIGSTTGDDARESEIEKVEKKANEFSPLYWQKAPSGKVAQLLTMASTNAIIKNIESGIGYVWDTPEKILGSFRQLKYKTQVSWIADNWQRKHGTDLQAYLSDKLDTDKQREVYLEILSITKNLPTGYLKK